MLSICNGVTLADNSAHAMEIPIVATTKRSDLSQVKTFKSIATTSAALQTVLAKIRETNTIEKSAIQDAVADTITIIEIRRR